MKKLLLIYLISLFSTTANAQNKMVPENRSGNSNPVQNGNNDCVEGDCQNGFGIKMIGDKIFNGFFENGKENGPGMLFNKDYYFLSNWKNGRNKGFGILVEGEDYAHGFFEDYKLNERGLKKTNGVTEYGRFYDGKVFPYPYKLYKNGTEKGCTVGNCNTLYGKFVYENGTNFTGFFLNGSPEQGVYGDLSKNYYEGYFNVAGQPHGIGRVDFADGSRYFGEFVNGKREGKGYYFVKDAKSKTFWGIWKSDQLIKDFSVVKENQPNFLPTPKGPGIASYIDRVEKSNEVIATKETSKKVESKSNSDYRYSDLGFGDPYDYLNNKNNTKDIAKIYPGYNGSNKDFLVAEILKAARKFVTPELQNSMLLKKIEELYGINKRVSYEVFIQLPTSSVMQLENYVSSEILKYYRAESKK